MTANQKVLSIILLALSHAGGNLCLVIFITYVLIQAKVDILYQSIALEALSFLSADVLILLRRVLDLVVKKLVVAAPLILCPIRRNLLYLFKLTLNRCQVVIKRAALLSNEVICLIIQKIVVTLDVIILQLVSYALWLRF